MRHTSTFGILVALLLSGPDARPTGQAPVASALPASAVLDEWGNRFTSLGASVPENSLRTQVRTTIAQLAMFDAVNAVLDGAYRPFASKPVSAPGASPEAAAIRAAYIVALNEFPTKTATIDSAYNTSIAAVLASGEAIAVASRWASRSERGARGARWRSPQRSGVRRLHPRQRPRSVDADPTRIGESADAVPPVRHAIRI
jgi:hypothetical protein